MAQDLEKLEEQYEEIMGLYDLADDLANTVDGRFVDNPEQQFYLVEPLIEKLGESADELTEEFVNLAEGKAPSKSKVKVESALRKIYAAIDDYYVRAHGELKRVSNDAINIADAIVQKIKDKLERVIVIFLEFVKLSLDTVMHKQQFEELKRRQTHIAFQLHEAAQQQP